MIDLRYLNILQYIYKTNLMQSKVIALSSLIELFFLINVF